MISCLISAPTKQHRSQMKQEAIQRVSHHLICLCAQRDEEGYQPAERSKTSDPRFHETYSPFKLPTDDEVFMFREAERQKKLDARRTTNDLKIWEKKTANSRVPLKQFNKESLPQLNSEAPQKRIFSTKDKKVIEDALEIINERKKNQDQGAKKMKEGTLELVEQKKEMFLVEMSMGIINKEIERLKKIADDKKHALEQSEKMLQMDSEEFHTYVERNKRETELAIQKADHETKEKKAREVDIKNLTQKQTSLRADISRNEDTLVRYKEHRDFLEKLTPKDFLEYKKKKREEKIEEIKSQWMVKMLQEAEQDESESNQSFSQVRNNVPQFGRGLVRNLGGINASTQKPANKPPSIKTLEERFAKTMASGEFKEELEEFDDEFELYFKEPHQLIEVFSVIEEKNLFLIQMTQDSEQTLEELKVSFHNRQIALDKKRNQLRETRQQLEKQIAEAEQKMNQLLRKNEENKQSTKRDDLHPLVKKVGEIYNFLKKNENFDLPELDTKDIFRVLTTIEGYLEKQLIKQAKQYNPERIEYYKKQIRKSQQRESQKTIVEKQNAEKNKLSQMRANRQRKKRTGRVDMARSDFLVKREKKVEVLDDNEEDKDRKYFE
eukprot:TRINITY_DN3174_c0_g1_i13.p1 TRINITY_DN3174_c0_g1~~TRINITY_DN3174_c0_g1_i13.p1  ORF type:complete len:609 (+),score=154.52 TRINITY_DN3174_c0_g1_i13:151-1977(+)